MSKVKAPTLAERVAKLEEATGLRTTTAPPPDKPECLLYGELVSRATVEMFKFKDCAIVDLRAKLADVEKALASANRRGDEYLSMYNSACRQLSDKRIAHEAEKLKAGNCVSVPSPNYGDEPSLFPASFFVGGLSGAVLGGIGALIACGGIL